MRRADIDQVTAAFAVMLRSYNRHPDAGLILQYVAAVEKLPTKVILEGIKASVKYCEQCPSPAEVRRNAESRRRWQVVLDRTRMLLRPPDVKQLTAGDDGTRPPMFRLTRPKDEARPRPLTPERRRREGETPEVAIARIKAQAAEIGVSKADIEQAKKLYG